MIEATRNFRRSETRLNHPIPSSSQVERLKGQAGTLLYGHKVAQLFGSFRLQSNTHTHTRTQRDVETSVSVHIFDMTTFCGRYWL